MRSDKRLRVEKEYIKPKRFNPASLSVKDQEAVIEYYLGAHPKFFLYVGTTLFVDIYNMNLEGKEFNGFKPQLKLMGIE